METLTYFVPIDFSACSYNALHYTTMLARCSQGVIKLCHVIDLDEIPDSENPVVVSFAIDRLVKKAEDRMKSLREIISLDGVNVKADIVMGNVHTQLMNQIETIKPNVIVMGKEVGKITGARSLLKYITRNTSVPVLMVPESHNPRIPNRAVLASDMNPEREIEFAPFIDIVKKVSHELSILNIRSGYFNNAKDTLKWINNLNETYGINAKLLSRENKNGVKSIVDFVRTNKVDLLCTVRYNTSLYDKLFDRSFTNQLTSEVEVPVLVIKE